MRLSEAGHTTVGHHWLARAQPESVCDVNAALELARDAIAKKKFLDALRQVRGVLRFDKNNWQLHESAGFCYLNLKQPQFALVHYLRALELHPRESAVHTMLALILWRLRCFEEARWHAEIAMRRDPRSLAIHVNLSVIYEALGEHEKARHLEERGVRFFPHDSQLQMNLSMLRLYLGDHAAGWAGYEYRLRRPESFNFRGSVLKRKRWDGTSFAGRTLLIYGEQGLGDNLMAAHQIARVKTLGGTVVYEVPQELTGVLRGLPGVDRMVPYHPLNEPEGDYDFWLPLLSVYHLLKLTPAQYLATTPYVGVVPDAKLDIFWDEWVTSQAGKQFRVGVAWSGNPNHGNDAARSIPFDDFRLLFEGVDATFFALQLVGAKDLQSANQCGIRNATSALVSFDDTLALARRMDLIICVDTGVVHLAGAAGLEVWLLLPKQPEWRWGHQDRPTVWYPSLRQFRARHVDDWVGLVDEVRTQLKLRIASGSQKYDPPV